MTNIANISRRNFFKLALGGAVIAASATPAIAAALRVSYADKIRTLIRLHSELVTLDTAQKATRGMSRDAVNAKFDELLGYVMDNFKAPVKGGEGYAETKTAVRKLFHREEYTTDSWKDVPPTMPEGAITVAIARDILSVHRVRIDPSKMVNFSRFADVYQDIILDA